MTHRHREGLARASALAAIGACVFASALLVSSTDSEAKKAKPAAQAPSGPQAPQTPADAKAQEAAAAHQAYDAGLKSYAAGKYVPATEQLTTALKGGGLTSAEMAKALYTRGLSYKKQNKPGLAISDLTSALWLKNGLNGTDRQTAMAERAEAYSAAGIADAGSSGTERVVVADPNPSSNAAGLSAAAVAEAASGGSSSAFAGSPGAGAQAPITRQDANSEAAQDAARARAAAAQQVTGGGLESAISSSSVVTSGAAAPASANSASLAFASSAQAAPEAASTAPAPSLSAVQTDAPSTPASSPSMMSSVTGFFSNMFGGSSSAPEPPPASVTTASTEQAPLPETSSWSSNTIVKQGAANKAASKAPVVAMASPQPAAKIAKAPAGKYKVHIAAVRSKPEAEALAQQLVAQHGADLGNHTPTVDETVIGSMGTFYRVRVGGYASQDEPRGLCNKLRSSGLDCLVVTN